MSTPAIRVEASGNVSRIVGIWALLLIAALYIVAIESHGIVAPRRTNRTNLAICCSRLTPLGVEQVDGPRCRHRLCLKMQLMGGLIVERPIIDEQRISGMTRVCRWKVEVCFPNQIVAMRPSQS